MSGIAVWFLEDGGQRPEDVAERVASFLDEATRSLDVAIYDFEARSGATARIADALERASKRGVSVRVVFNGEACEHPADARPAQCDHDEIDGLEVPTQGVFDPGSLMHHKYVIRDGVDVWTGSTNWTHDSFAREENVQVLITGSAALAQTYMRNFERIWSRDRTDRTGASGPPVGLDRGVRVQPYFSPKPPYLGNVAADRIVSADRRIRVVSPVVTSGAVLGTLCEHIARQSIDVGGAFDRTQMEQVQSQWALVPHNTWKLDAWNTIEPYLVGKRSTPYRPGAVHDYLHAKFVVVDHEVLAGSYNLSKHGEVNAENVLHIVDNDLADRFVAFADEVIDRYHDVPVDQALPRPEAAERSATIS